MAVLKGWRKAETESGWRGARAPHKRLRVQAWGRLPHPPPTAWAASTKVWS